MSLSIQFILLSLLPWTSIHVVSNGSVSSLSGMIVLGVCIVWRVCVCVCVCVCIQLSWWLSSKNNLPARQERQEMWVWSLGREDPLQEGMATHSTILAWRIPWTEELEGLQSMGSQRVGHNWAHTHTHCLYVYIYISFIHPSVDTWVISIHNHYSVFCSLLAAGLSFLLAVISLLSVALGLRCCAQALSSCPQQGLFFVVEHGP